MILADVTLQLRVQNDVRTGELPAPIASRLEKHASDHPSAEYLKVIVADIGTVGLRNALDGARTRVADMMASAKFKYGEDRVLALQKILPDLEVNAQKSCRESGYAFSSLKRVSQNLLADTTSVSPTTELPNTIAISPSISEQKSSVADSPAHNSGSLNAERETSESTPNNGDFREAHNSSETKARLASTEEVEIDTDSTRTATPALELTAAEQKQSDISKRIKIKYDEFEKTTKYDGPLEKWENCDNIFLRAWKADSAKDTAYQIYVIDYYNGKWRFYKYGYDDDGNALDVISIDRDVDSCRYGNCSLREHVGINVSRKYLENRKDRGIKFKISGDAGEEICGLDSPYIKAFLATIPSNSSYQIVNKNSTNASISGIKNDNRTQEDRYIGVLLGGRVLCSMAYLLSKKIEYAKSKGASINEDDEKISNVGECIRERLTILKNEYTKFLDLQKSKKAKLALTNHYAAAVILIKGINSLAGESKDSFKARQETNKRRMDEKWAQYELVK